MRPAYRFPPIALPFLLLGFSALTGAKPADAIEVWVVTDALHPVTSIGTARVIELDAPARVELTLSRQLPRDPQQAAQIVRQRLRSDEAGIAHQLSASYQGVADAWSMGITTLPAVIVDRRYVVYGDPDVAHAVARIQAYRRVHP